MKTYWQEILDYYYDLPYEALDEKTIHQVRRSFLDYYGCAVYTANAKCCSEMVDVILDMQAPGSYPVWGSERTSGIIGAACANASRVSNIEMDDGSGINAAVHPGLYVWTGAIAAYQQKPCDIKTLFKAVVFGYDVCMRMGMLAQKNVSRLGLHGPGMAGGLGTVAAAGMILGLDKEQMQNAFGITGSLLPICPFVTFTKGADAKDLYGGWGVMLGLMAVEAAKRGLTGPKEIMDGVKSLKSIFADSRGKDTAMGDPYYINVIGFKEFPACLAVHPALISLKTLQQKHAFRAEDVVRVHARVSRAAFNLSNGAPKALTPTAARLYLPYVLAAALYYGELLPEFFTPDYIANGPFRALEDRISVSEKTEYTTETTSIRACELTIELKDGTVLCEETLGIRWCDVGASDEGLIEKFRMLTNGIFEADETEEILNTILSLEDSAQLESVLAALCSL